MFFTVLLTACCAPPSELTYPVTDRDQPAVGAKAYLMPLKISMFDTVPDGSLITAITDDKGIIRVIPKSDDVQYYRVLVRGQNGHSGYGTLMGSVDRYPQNIELRENQTVTGRVTDKEGKAIAGMTFKAAALGPESFARFGGLLLSTAVTTPKFWDGFPISQAADGTISVPGVAVEHSVAVDYQSKEHGHGQFWFLPDGKSTYTLAKSGAIRIQLKAGKDAVPGELQVIAERSYRGDNLVCKATAISKAGGELLLSNLPPGEYTLRFPVISQADYYPKALGKVTVKSGETTELSTVMEAAARIKVAFVDSKSNQAVPKGKLQVTIGTERENLITLDNAVADQAGQVELRIPSGVVQLMPLSVKGYTALNVSSNQFNSHSTEPKPLAPGQTHDFGTFTLAKNVTFSGIVVDDQDRPISDAKIRVGYCPSVGSSDKIVSDVQGRFQIPDVNPEAGVFGVTATKDEMITAAPVSVKSDDSNSEIRVVISPKHWVRFSGRIVNRAGQPVPDVKVQMMHSVTFISTNGAISGGGVGRDRPRTDSAGNINAGALQAGDQYSFTFSKPGFQNAATKQIIPKPGETIALGDIVLKRSDLAIRGIVTDLNGNPVGGAMVFDHADGPTFVKAITNAKGEFDLKGLYEGPAIISVKADGFAFASIPVASVEGLTAIKLRKRTDPIPALPAIPESQRQATRDLAKHVFTTMWENREAAKDDGNAIIRSMATFDIQTARKWAGDKKEWLDEIQTVEQKKRLKLVSKSDPDEAISLLKSKSGTEQFRDICSLSRQFLTESPETAMRYAEEAVALARGGEEKNRAYMLAEAGELIYFAGKKEAGRKLIEEATVLGQKDGFEGLDSYRRGMVACRVALYDPAKCRAMIKPLKSSDEFNRWLAQSCKRVAEHDPELALKWYADFLQGNSFDKFKTKQFIAYRVFQSDPKRAVEIAKTIEDPTTRATTLSQIALLSKDKAFAVQVLDEALDHIVKDPEHYYNGPGGTAALLLMRAQKLGHPDLVEVRDKVLAARWSEASSFGAQFLGDSVCKMSSVLAATDPATAKTLLLRQFPMQSITKLGLQPWHLKEVVVAFAMADPENAVPLYDLLLKQAIEMKRGYDLGNMISLAAILAEPEKVAETGIRSLHLIDQFEEE